MPKKHIKYEVTRQAGARVGWQPGGAARGNWLSACVMSARLHFYWDTQWKKMVIILLKHSGCLFLLSRNRELVHQPCCVSAPEVRCGGF